MSFFTDLLVADSEDSVRDIVIGHAQAAGLDITNWINIGVGSQTLEYVTGAIFGFVSIRARIVRGFASLDTATDPGDPDAYDSSNEGLAPVPGFLTSYGANVHGTEREGETYATGFFTLQNGSASPSQIRTFQPGALTFQWTGGSPPSPAPTYRNAADDSIYTNPDGSVTIPLGGSVVLPVIAEIKGSIASAPPSVLSMTSVMVGVTGTNAAAVIGTDREDAALYRERCRQASVRLSLAGPEDLYKYLATTNLDGSVLLNENDVASAITRIYVSQDSATGEVDLYYASASGAALTVDVDAANANIALYAFAVPGAITVGPAAEGGEAATEVTINIVGTASIQRVAGLSDAALILAARTAIVAAEVAAFATFKIGGRDQVAGAGVIYTADLEGIARNAYPGLYNVLVSTPAGATTALAAGEVAVVDTVLADWTITLTN